MEFMKFLNIMYSRLSYVILVPLYAALWVVILLSINNDSYKSTPMHKDVFQTQINEYCTDSNFKKLERSHVSFLKVHKTASTTVQNIFLRFGQSRNLTFILSHDKAGMAEFENFPNIISVKESLSDKNIVPPPSGKHYDILCCHVVYDRGKFKKYLPRDAFYLGLVREPIERLESAFAYFRYLKSINLSEYARDPYLHHNYVGSMTNNRMAFAFGFPLSVFVKNNSSSFTKVLQRQVDDYLAKIRSDFDLILVHEKLNHSLVLMKRLLQWHVKDIIFISRFHLSEHKRRFFKSERDTIRSYLNLDYMLYEFALSELNRKVENMNDDFIEEVKLFTEIIEKVSYFCHDDTIGPIRIASSKWDSCFNVTKIDCDQYIKPEVRFIEEIRMRQYGRLNI